MTRRPLLRRTGAVVVLVSALVLAGCGGGDGEGKPASSSPTVDLPTGSVDVPEGVQLTKPGTVLEFGEAAVVAYEPNSERTSMLSLAVEGVRTGRMKDFAAYQMERATRRSTPYYVRAKVKNVGDGNLSRTAVPLLAVDTRNTLIQPSNFTTPFRTCPSQPLPKGFTAGKSATVCMVYLVPAGGKLTEMSFRPVQAFEPILWRGKVQPPHGAKPGKKGAKPGKKDVKPGKKGVRGGGKQRKKQP